MLVEASLVTDPVTIQLAWGAILGAVMGGASTAAAVGGVAAEAAGAAASAAGSAVAQGAASAGSAVAKGATAAAGAGKDIAGAVKSAGTAVKDLAIDTGKAKVKEFKANITEHPFSKLAQGEDVGAQDFEAVQQRRGTRRIQPARGGPTGQRQLSIPPSQVGSWNRMGRVMSLGGGGGGPRVTF